MGVSLSKTRKHLSSGIPTYIDGCDEEPYVESFNSQLRQSTTRFLRRLAGDIQVRSPSLASISELTSCLFHPNQQVVQLILGSEDDIVNNPDLLDLVKDYFDSTYHTLNLCNALKKSLYDARDSQFMIQVILQEFEKVKQPGGGKEIYEPTLQQLKKFKSADNKSNQDFSSLLTSVCENLFLLLEKLQAKKSKLDKNLNKVKAWRTLSNLIFVVTFASVLVCSVLAAAPPIVTAVAAAAAIPAGNMGEWINSLWNKYENELKGQRKIVSTTYAWTGIGKGDLDNIGALVDKWEFEIESMLQNDGSASGDGTAMDELKKELSQFMKTVKDLSDNTDNCSSDIMKGREKFSEMMVNKHRND